MKRKKSKLTAEEVKYRPTARERSALVRIVSRNAAETTPRIKVELNDGKAAAISLDHPNRLIGYALLMEALGTVDFDFINGLLNQLCNAASKGGQTDEDGINFMLSIIKGVKPKDQLEVMLTAQMAAVHMATMTFARRLQHVENIAQQDSAERAFNKLLRTFSMQLEALKRYRTGGEQKVTVQHVSVSEGGQAIVGNVTQATPETAPEKPANETPALTDARQPAMSNLSKRERETVALRRKQKDAKRSPA